MQQKFKSIGLLNINGSIDKGGKKEFFKSWINNIMSWKPGEIIHNALFDRTETKLLVSNSKLWIHDGSLESTM